jgi:hypothetical protein
MPDQFGNPLEREIWRRLPSVTQEDIQRNQWPQEVEVLEVSWDVRHGDDFHIVRYSGDHGRSQPSVTMGGFMRRYEFASAPIAPELRAAIERLSDAVDTYRYAGMQEPGKVLGVVVPIDEDILKETHLNYERLQVIVRGQFRGYVVMGRDMLERALRDMQPTPEPPTDRPTQWDRLDEEEG